MNKKQKIQLVLLALLLLSSTFSWTQERTANNNLRDLIGYYANNAAIITACEKVEVAKIWEVKVWTYDTKTAYVTNTIQQWMEGKTKSVVLAIPLEDKTIEPQFIFSSDLEASLDLAAAEKIITNIVKPEIAISNYESAGVKGIEALLGIPTASGINIEFIGHEKQKRGFDPNSIKTYKQYTTQFGKPVAWKSLVKGEKDFVKLNYSGIAKKDISFKVDDNSKAKIEFIAPLTTSQLSYNLNLEDEEVEHTTYVTNSKSNPSGGKVGVIKSIAYPHRKDWTIKFFVIHPKGGTKTVIPTFTGDELRAYLNDKTYGEANYAFKFIYKEDKDMPKMEELTIDFDTSPKNGLFDFYNKTTDSYDFNQPECVAIFTKVNEYINVSKHEIPVVFIDNLKPPPPTSSAGIIAGKGPFGENRVIVIADNNIIGKKTNTTILNTIAHEIGHTHFNLYHPWQDVINCPSYIKGSDPANVMDYEDGDEFRKYQWDIITQH